MVSIIVENYLGPCKLIWRKKDASMNFRGDEMLNLISVIDDDKEPVIHISLLLLRVPKGPRMWFVVIEVSLVMKRKSQLLLRLNLPAEKTVRRQKECKKIQHQGSGLALTVFREYKTFTIICDGFVITNLYLMIFISLKESN